MSRLVGWRTVIVNAVLVVVGVLRHRHPDKVPDDATVLALMNTILDAIFSAPGAGLVNILMRVFLTQTKFPLRP